MTSRVRTPTFLGEAAFGFGISLVATTVAVSLSFVLPVPIVARLIVAALGLTLVLRAIGRSREKTGRVVTLAVWIAAAVALGIADLSLPIYVALHATFAWLVRSLFTHSRLVDAGLDFGLTLLALSFAIFAAMRTESVFLSVWCFLLVQAFAPSISKLVARAAAPGDDDMPHSDPNRGFAEAFKTADEALHRIAARR